MPAKSPKQERFMQAVKNNPAFAKKAGVSKGTAEKFVGAKAHKGKPKKMAMGGKAC
jgi:hypothetical protein